MEIVKVPKRRKRGVNEHTSRLKSPLLVRKDGQRLRTVLIQKRRNWKRLQDYFEDSPDVDEPPKEAGEDWETVDRVEETRSKLMQYIDWARSWISSWIKRQ